jgi:hypothetical protein
VMNALLDAFPKRRRVRGTPACGHGVGVPGGEGPPDSRKITSSVLVEVIATPPATGARGRAYQVIRYGIGRGHTCDPITLLTHKREILEWLDGLKRQGRVFAIPARSGALPETGPRLS